MSGRVGNKLEAFRGPSVARFWDIEIIRDVVTVEENLDAIIEVRMRCIGGLGIYELVMDAKRQKQRSVRISRMKPDAEVVAGFRQGEVPYAAQEVTKPTGVGEIDIDTRPVFA